MFRLDWTKMSRTEPFKAIPYVTSKEVDTAERLLKDIKFEEIDEFIDYGLTQPATAPIKL